MKQRGFTIIELLIIITVLSFGILGVYNVFYPAVALTRDVSLRMTATHLAGEGMEIVRNIRDNNSLQRTVNRSVVWTLLLDQCRIGCQMDYKTGTLAGGTRHQVAVFDPSAFLMLDSDGLYSYGSGVETPFTRKITIDQEEGKDTLHVVVEVLWSDSGKSHSVSTEGYLYNWR